MTTVVKLDYLLESGWGFYLFSLLVFFLFLKENIGGLFALVILRTVQNHFEHNMQL